MTKDGWKGKGGVSVFLGLVPGEVVLGFTSCDKPALTSACDDACCLLPFDLTFSSLLSSASVPDGDDLLLLDFKGLYLEADDSALLSPYLRMLAAASKDCLVGVLLLVGLLLLLLFTHFPLYPPPLMARRTSSSKAINFEREH